MRLLDLEFQRHRRTRPQGWALLLAGTLLAAPVLYLQQQTATAVAVQEQLLRRVELQLQGEHGSQARLSAAESRAQEAALAEMRRVSAQMNLPWNALFATLETLRLDDVALLSLAPDARKRQLRISAEARDLAAMLEFHQRLEQSAELSDVSLLNHEVVTQTAERPIRFNLVTTWVLNDARP